MKKRIFIPCVLLVFAFAVKSQSLNGTSWQFLSFDNLKMSTVKAVEDKMQATLTFESDSVYKGKMCNNYMGTFIVGQKNGLTMSQANSTKMYCLGVSDVEKELLGFYVKAVRYAIEGDRLLIFTTNDYRLTFKRQ